jgi:hypothetical protein
MKKEDRQPWNAFPLAALSVRGISPTAANILHYLATRSNWKGEVWVGQRRIADDLIRSKDYVTRGIRELEEAKLITTVGRKRADKQADKHLISSSILSKEHQEILAKATANNPEEQEDCETNNPEGQDNSPSNNPDSQSNNPDRQDFNNPDFGSNNPDRQDETLQLEPRSVNPNLTVEKPKSKNKEGKKEGKNEDGSSLRSSPSLSGEIQELLKPVPDDSITSLEEVRIGELCSYWWNKTDRGWMEWEADDTSDFIGSDNFAAIRMLRQYGWIKVLDVLYLTFECPKTAGVPWTDWWFWCKQFELTHRTGNAWRNKLMAKGVESKTSKPCRNYAECKGWQVRDTLCLDCWTDVVRALGRESCLHPHRMFHEECFECGHMKVDPETCIHEHLDEDGNQCRDCGKLRGVAAEAKHA